MSNMTYLPLLRITPDNLRRIGFKKRNEKKSGYHLLIPGCDLFFHGWYVVPEKDLFTIHCSHKDNGGSFLKIRENINDMGVVKRIYEALSDKELKIDYYD